MANDPIRLEPPNAADMDDADPLVEECIRDALDPYMAALSPEQVVDYRAFLAAFITTHPAVEPLYGRLRERPVALAASGEVPRDHDDAPRVDADGTLGQRQR